MADKRDIRRIKKRITIKFGLNDTARVAFTEDISITGMFIKTANTVPPNSKIKIEFSIEEEKKIEVEARVMWSKKVPQNLFHLAKKGGMGVHFLTFNAGEDHFNSFFDRMLTEASNGGGS